MKPRTLWLASTLAAVAGSLLWIGCGGDDTSGTSPADAGTDHSVGTDAPNGGDTGGGGDSAPGPDTGTDAGFKVCPPGIQPTFTSINANVLQKVCIFCHKANYTDPSGKVFAGGAGGMILTLPVDAGAGDGGDAGDNDGGDAAAPAVGPYAALVNAHANNFAGTDKATYTVRVAPGDPAHSFLPKKLSIKGSDPLYGSGMPLTAPGSVCPETLDAITTWIQNGAQND
jgi:hypothetical protein